MNLVGIDEVGRGPLAGPLVVGAVCFRSDTDKTKDWYKSLTDSKKLSHKKRLELSEKIKQSSYYALGWVFPAELDKLGIAKSLKIATFRAISKLATNHNIKIEQIIIDGNINFLKDTIYESNVATLIKADATVKEVSASSILAKTARDNYMIELSKKYPNYGFNKHMGYGTKQHLQAIWQFGATIHHRFSYAPLKTQKISTTRIGHSAENLVVDFLRSNHHEIIAQNFKTKAYEIDIISKLDQTVFFTEVRARKLFQHNFISPIDTISSKKLQQMKFSVDQYIKTYGKNLQSNFKLAIAEVYHQEDEYFLHNWLEIE